MGYLKRIYSLNLSDEEILRRIGAHKAKAAKQIAREQVVINIKKDRITKQLEAYSNRAEIKAGLKLSCKDRKMIKNRECRQARLAALT